LAATSVRRCIGVSRRYQDAFAAISAILSSPRTPACGGLACFAAQQQPCAVLAYALEP
jgi:hypothetical protein